MVNDKCLGFFSDFAGNFLAQKHDKWMKNKANVTGVQYLCTFHQVVSNVSFISFILFVFILLPHYLIQLPFFLLPLTPTECATPPAPVSIIKSNTSFPLTVDEALVATELLHLPPRLQRRIFCRACRWFRKRPPFPTTSVICSHPHCRRHCQWWPLIAAYTLLPVLISSKISVPPPVSLCVAPLPAAPLHTCHPLSWRLWQRGFRWRIWGRSSGIRSRDQAWHQSWVRFRFCSATFLPLLLLLLLLLLPPSSFPNQTAAVFNIHDQVLPLDATVVAVGYLPPRAVLFTNLLAALSS